MTATLSPEVRPRLDAHLDAVERALLAASNSRERRRGIVDDLEAQIQDMLAARSESPTAADLDAVLAELDPPSAYGDAAARPTAAPPPRPAGPAMRETFATVFPAPASAASAVAPTPPAVPRSPRFSRTALWGFVFVLLSLLPLPLVLVGTFFFAQRAVTSHEWATQPPAFPGMPEAPVVHHVAQSPNWTNVAIFGVSLLLFTGPLALTGTILGWIAFGQIRHAAGALRGMGLALFDGLFYPLLFLVSSVLTPFFLPLLGLAAIAACIAVVYLIIRMANGHRVFT